MIKVPAGTGSACPSTALSQSICILETELSKIDVDDFDVLLPRVIAEDIATLATKDRLFLKTSRGCKQIRFVRGAVQPNFDRKPTADQLRKAGFRPRRQADHILLRDQLLLAVNDTYANPWERIGPRRMVKHVLGTVNKASVQKLAFVHVEGRRSKVSSAVQLYWIMPEVYLSALLRLVRSVHSWEPAGQDNEHPPYSILK